LPSSLIEIPILHTIEVEELLDIAEKIDKGEPVSEHSLIKQLQKQKYVRDLGRNRFNKTRKGQELFDLLFFYSTD